MDPAAICDDGVHVTVPTLSMRNVLMDIVAVTDPFLFVAVIDTLYMD